MYNSIYYSIINILEIDIKANQRKSIHGQWSSKLIFIFAATGSAVGLGNIWKFPWMTSEYGGGAFVLIYILSVILIALPIMIAEVLIGRHGKQNPVGSLKYLSNESSTFHITEIDQDLHRTTTKSKKYSNADDYTNWQLVGWSGMIAGILILSFYSVIAGWTMSYIFKAFSGTFSGIGVEESRLMFDSFVSDPEKLLGWHTIFMLLTCYIVSKGVKGGLEKSVKILIPGLFILLIGLAIYASTLNGFHDGSISIVDENGVVAHLLEERYVHVKHQGPPMVCLSKIEDYIDTFDDLSFTHLFHQFADFNWAIAYLHYISKVTTPDKLMTPMIHGGHHDLHAICGFSHSGFDDAVVVVIDGAGSTFEYGKENQTIYEIYEIISK